VAGFQAFALPIEFRGGGVCANISWT
jgi:hypothetical protein